MNPPGKTHKVYIVVRGYKPGAYQHNEDWEKQIWSYPNYIIKSFKHLNPALEWWRATDVDKNVSEEEIQKAFAKRDELRDNPKKKEEKKKETITPVITETSVIEVCRSPLKIYTDGSVTGDQQAAGWAGVVLNGANVCLRVKDKLKAKKIGSCTIELIAMLKVLKYLKKNDWNLNDATIYTDSQYVRTHWLKNVRPNDKNKKIWKKLWKILIQYNISIHWIKGHAGNVHNEECDKLAKEAASAQLVLLQAKQIKKESKKKNVAC